MSRRPRRSTRTATLFPYTTLFRSESPFEGLVDLWTLEGGQRQDRPTAHRRLVASGRQDGGQGGFVTDRAERRHRGLAHRSEEHTSELQSLMRISYAVFCLKKKKTTAIPTHRQHKTAPSHESA